MFTTCINTLTDLVEFLEKIKLSAKYTQPVKSLSNATIGGHTRHIIELFQCLINGYEAGIVNYDNRKRDTALENDAAFAIKAIENIQHKLLVPDKPLHIEVAIDNTVHYHILSNYKREVLYNLEHCIHHQALIKVALIEMKVNFVTEQFGVAASTLQYWEQCAQ